MKYLFNHLDEIREKVVESPRTYILLDCDGTITRIRSDPRQVALSQRMLQVLRSLSTTPSCILAVVSGRPVSDLQRLVKINGVYYIGNHGFEISGKHLSYKNRTAQKSRRSIDQFSRALRSLETIGATIEEKQFSVAVHFRRAPLRSIPTIRTFVSALVSGQAEFKIMHGKKVVEVMPRTKWDKGTAAKWLMHHIGNGLPIFVGDDLIDEDAFYRISSKGVTIVVSRRRRATYAKYYLSDVSEVYRFLKLLSAWVRVGG